MKWLDQLWCDHDYHVVDEYRKFQMYCGAMRHFDYVRVYCPKCNRRKDMHATEWGRLLKENMCRAREEEIKKNYQKPLAK